MDALMRMTGAVAALGAALIALAVGAASVPWLAVPLLAAGVGQAAVAVLALRGGRLHDAGTFGERLDKADLPLGRPAVVARAQRHRGEGRGGVGRGRRGIVVRRGGARGDFFLLHPTG